MGRSASILCSKVLIEMILRRSLGGAPPICEGGLRRPGSRSGSATPWVAVVALAVLWGAGAAGPAGCSRGQQTLEPPAPTARGAQLLDLEEQEQVLASLRQAAGDYRSTSPPGSAPQGWRWSDVPKAVAEACGDVEMAVFVSKVGDTRAVFTLRTADDRPGEMTVTRTDAEQGYAATATIGRFDDDPERVRKLVEAFEIHLRKLGERVSFEDD